MATLKGQTVAASYQDLLKRADTYSQTGTNIELMDDSAVVKPTGLYLESGATTDFIGIGVADPDSVMEIYSNSTGFDLLHLHHGSSRYHAANSFINMDYNGNTFEIYTDGVNDFNLKNNNTNTRIDTLVGKSLILQETGGKIGIDIETPPNTLSVSPVQYSTGTASQSGTTVTGSGTTWTAAMVGSQLVYADMTSSGVITARASNTSITVTTSQTVSSQAYKIHYQGLQVKSDGLVGVGKSVPTQKVHIYEGSGESDLTVESTLGALTIFMNNANANPAVFWKTGGDLRFATSTDGVATSGFSEKVRITSGGGIHEVGGVLKENLLTNSGFDVWSNSTLVEVTSGAAPVTAGATSALTNNLVALGGFDNGGGTSGWSTTGTIAIEDDAGAEGGALKVTTGSTNHWAEEIVTTVVGKLYYFSVYQKNGDANSQVLVGSSSGGGQYVGESPANAGSFGQVGPFVFEATSTSTYINLRTMGTSGYSYFDRCVLYEVTPGCVATDTKMPDGWYKDSHSGSDAWRMHSDGATESVTHTGSFYALKFTFGGAGYEFKWNVTGEEQVRRYADRTVTAGCWMKSSSATLLKISDSAGNVTTAHGGGGGWEWLELSRTFADSITSVNPFVVRAAGTETIYLSQPMLVFGSSIGEGNYTRPQGEVVWFEKQVDSNLYEGLTGQSDQAMTTLNLEADSNGAIPKGAKAVMVYNFIKDSGSAAGQPYLRMDAGSAVGNFFVNEASGITNDAQSRASGIQNCDENGDIRVQMEATGSGTLDIDGFEYKGVQLR